MKHNDEKDPLKENDFSEQKPEDEKIKSEKEEENITPRASQEKEPESPEENGFAESASDQGPEESEVPDQPVQSKTSVQSKASDQSEAPDQSDQSEAPDQSEQSGQSVQPEEKVKGKKKSSADTGRRQLVDDEEEQNSNASYDDTVDHDEEDHDEEDHDEEDHDEEDHDEKDLDEEDHDEKDLDEEQINYGLLSKEDLVKLLREKLDNPGKGNIRREVTEIKKAFYGKINEAVEEKKQHFLGEGGELEDFKPVEEPVELEMKELLHKYRGLRAEFTRQLEKTKQENLLKKQEILEQLRILMESQESFEVTFRKFKSLQKQWFAAGVVPQQNLKDLWDSYNYFVDKFNDYVRINRELRTLDLKKNLELKIKLCEQTEELDQDPNIVQAFKALQKHHARWREIGPVPREDRDEVWERFKQATSLINRKHQEYHAKLKESLYDNLRYKTELCEKVEQIASQDYDSHGSWVERTNAVLEIQKTWKSIGYAPKKDNNAIYTRFRSACDEFFGKKARFYAAAYEEQKHNLQQKLEITEKAEELSKNEEWKETTAELIRLQKQWKEIGPVPRRDSDKLWRRFRSACDTFFNNKSKYFEDVDSSFEDNLNTKEELIKEMDEFKPAREQKKNLEALEDFQQRFNKIGYVPSGKKDWIKERFRQAQDNLLERFGMDESERSLYKFRNRISGILNAPRSEMKLNFERDKLINKLQQLKNDIGVWENNIGFFKQSDSSEETIQGFNEKIETAHERIRLLEEKIRILDDMESSN